MYVTLFYATGPGWLPDTPVFGQSRAAMRALAGHRDYLQKLLEAGKLVIGGPYTNGTGGMALFEVESEQEAETILANDPAIISGVFVGERRQWVPEFSRGFDLSAEPSP